MKRILAYAAVYLLWGGSFLAIRVVVLAMPPFLAAGVRFFTAGLILVIFSMCRGLALPKGLEWRNVVVLAITFFLGGYALLFVAEQRLPSGIAAVIAAMIPAEIFLLEWLWLRRVRLTMTTAIGLVLGIGGVAALVLPTGFFTGQAHPDRYAAISLGAATCWAVGTVLNTQLKLPEARPVNAGWQMGLGGVMLLALSGATGEWSRIDPAALTTRVWVSMGYLIVAASLIAFSAYVYLLQHEPAGRVASYAYVNPVVALLVGMWLGGEMLSARQGVACGVVIAGVLVTLLGRQGAVGRPGEVKV